MQPQSEPTAEPARFPMRFAIGNLIRKIDVKILAFAIIVIGIFLRLYQYLSNRSLWYDESLLSVNIIQKSFSELFSTLDHGQGAPILFLLIEKVLSNLIGNNEYALRLFPLMAGISAIFLTYKVIEYFVNRHAALVGTFILAVSQHLIYYSSEVKQYSSDVAIAALLYFLYKRLLEKNNFPFSKIIIFGFISCMVMWVSHPSIFIIAGIILVIIGKFIIDKRWKDLAYIFTTSMIVLSSFAVFYFISLNDLLHNTAFNHWLSAFMPTNPFSFQNTKWITSNFFILFQLPVGTPLLGIAALPFIVGFVSMFQRDKSNFFVLLTPVVLTLIASSLRMYPFVGRLTLFLTPSILIFISEGTRTIIRATWATSPIVGLVLSALLLLPPSFYTAHNVVIKQQRREEIKPIMRYIQRFKQPGDVLYLYYASHLPFEFYKDDYNLGGENYVVGVSSRNNWKPYIQDIDKLRGHQRVWFVFSHVHGHGSIDEEVIFIRHLDSIGRRLRSFKQPGASAYLYDLTL